MSGPYLLIIEGDTAKSREAEIATSGTSTSDDYAEVMRTLCAPSRIDIVYPADDGANLPAGAALDAYDGVIVTGSALHLYNGGPQIARQIELVREVLAHDTALFGSCWGLQVITAAAGGTVRRNPKGREFGIARNMHLTSEGRAHAMYRGKPSAFGASTVHLDEVETLPPGAKLLATNNFTQVQAFDLEGHKASTWAVQYHPEYPLREIAAITRRAPSLVAEGFFGTDQEREAFARDLEALERDPSQRGLAWRLGVDETVLDPTMRTRELANWIEALVLPGMARRGRG